MNKKTHAHAPRSRSSLNGALESWSHLVQERTVRTGFAANIARCASSRAHRMTVRECYVQWCKVCSGACACLGDWYGMGVGLLLRHMGGRGMYL